MSFLAIFRPDAKFVSHKQKDTGFEYRRIPVAHLVLIGDGEYGVARTLCVGADSRYTPPGRLLFVLTPVKLGRWFPYGPTKRAVGLIIDWRDTWVRRNFALGSSDFVLVLAFFFWRNLSFFLEAGVRLFEVFFVLLGVFCAFFGAVCF